MKIIIFIDEKQINGSIEPKIAITQIKELQKKHKQNCKDADCTLDQSYESLKKFFKETI